MTRRSSRRRFSSIAEQRTEQLEYRQLLSAVPAIDGSGNNLDHPDWGAADEPLLRTTTIEYANGQWEPGGENRISPRAISNFVAAQTESIPNDRYLTDFVWIWGQFLDHDIDLTEGAEPAEPLPIDVPTGDPFFDPFGTGTVTIGLNRSVYDEDSSGVRQQINQITAVIDGSVVYGSSPERAAALRTFQNGLLKTSEGNLLPFNEHGLHNAGGPSPSLFLAGDIRANENAALISMQTLWVREHNRIATELHESDAELTDEEIYQRARSLVTGQIQAITYNEFLPALLGRDALSDYSGYDATVNPGIANIFSTAAYRLGHSLLSPELVRLNHDGTPFDDGNLALRDAFFNVTPIITDGIAPILQGAATQLAQELDNHIIDDVCNFLFGPPGAGGFDLASLNIQRGRDHGLPDYNQARIDYGLDPVTTFADISSDLDTQAALAAAYGTVDDIDVWVGGLAEDHVPGSSVGELFQTILVDQFERLRDGDRFWYQNTLNQWDLFEVEATTLKDVIERNAAVCDLQSNVFFAPSVVYVALPDGERNRIEVRHRDGAIIVRDRNRGSRSFYNLAETDQIIIAGADFARDRVMIDVHLPPDALPGGIVLDGGAGRGDLLVVRGTAGNDLISFDSPELQSNHTRASATGWERLQIKTLGGHDQVVIADAAAVRVTVYGGAGNDTIIGGLRRDILAGGSGRDLIAGRNGRDRIIGGRGPDVLLGGSANDQIFGDFDEDVILDRQFGTAGSNPDDVPLPINTHRLNLLVQQFPDVLEEVIQDLTELG
ncbi:MAG: peroxidase family protein [Planctomycetota bacterium]|jgi:hypothetical protein